MKELAKFLIEAKKSTYADDSAKAKKLDDGSKELTYSKNGLNYRDRYFGFNPFSGQEVVFDNGIAVWSMNYYGLLCSGDVAADQLYKFLRKVMRLVEEKRPFRGPETFEEGEWGYSDNSIGDVNSFQGVEIIKFKGIIVYKLFYHGGVVSDKK